MSLGSSEVKIGSLERVRGETRFGVDQGLEGDLFLACVRAGQAPAEIKAINTGQAEQLPGVVRVFTAEDIPGEPLLGIIPVSKDQEFLAGKVVRHAGQAVALVAAKTRAQALAGARAVELSLKEIPGVFDAGEALEPGAPLVHPDLPDGNLLSRKIIKKGDVEKALAESHVVVTGTYTTSRLEHVALETEGGRADYKDGRVEVCACSQNPHYDRDDVARFLGLEKDQVRVVQAETGGGFGGKLDVSVQAYLALAAWHLKRSVRMTYIREESFIATGKRHPFVMHYTTGADKEGRLTAMKMDLLSDTGAFASYGLAVAMRAAVHAAGPYVVPNVHIDCRMAYTNNPWNGAMRGFGVPQVALAHEGQMDALAEKLGMDPWEIRYKNALRNGDVTATGQKLAGGVGLDQCFEKIKPIYDKWRKENKDSAALEGVGLGAMFYGIGNTGVSNPSAAEIEWTASGKVTLYTGVADIGQGSDTVLRQLAATRLGLAPGDIDLCRGDTACTENAGATSASRQTYISGNAVLAAADNLRMELAKAGREYLGARHLGLEQRGRVLEPVGAEGEALDVSRVIRETKGPDGAIKASGKFDPNFTALDPETGQGKPYATYAFAVQCARAKVNADSGMITVSDVAAAHDVGRAVNQRLVIGQIAGGVMMGVGMATMEEFEPGRHENLADYHIPTTADAPTITPMIVEEPEATGPYGAKGVGEPALIPTAPAVAGAVGQALNTPMRDLPMNLERVMEVLCKRDEEK